MTKFYDFIDNLDAAIKEFGIKYVFVESGRAAIERRCKDAGLNVSNYPNAMFWCELSWGSGEDKYDFAYNDFGVTLGEAMRHCLNAFVADVINGGQYQVDAAKEAGIYNKFIA